MPGGKSSTAIPDSPVVGNPDGDVVVVEFFDYRCPYCVRVAEDLREVGGRRRRHIRLVMKEFPDPRPRIAWSPHGWPWRPKSRANTSSCTSP